MSTATHRDQADQHFRVEGMSCEHCVRAVTEEVGRDEVAAAVDEAGYELGN